MFCRMKRLYPVYLVLLATALFDVVLCENKSASHTQKNGNRVTRQNNNADQMVQNILQWLQGVYTQNSRKIRQGSLREYLPPSNTQKPRPFETPKPDEGSSVDQDGYPNNISPPVSQPNFNGYTKQPSPSPPFEEQPGGYPTSGQPKTQFPGFPTARPTGYPTQQPGGNGGYSYNTPQPGFPTQRPGGGYSTQQPGGGYSTQQPGGGYSTQQPGGGYSTQRPGGGYSTQQPGGGYPSQQPGGGYPTQQPGGGYSTQQPGGGYPTQQPGGGYSTQQPGGGYSTQQPGGGYSTQQPGGGYSTQQPGGGYTTQRPGGGYTYSTPQPGFPTQQPGGGFTSQPGFPTQQPGGFSTQQPDYSTQQTGIPSQQPGGGYTTGQPGFPTQPGGGFTNGQPQQPSEGTTQQPGGGFTSKPGYSTEQPGATGQPGFPTQGPTEGPGTQGPSETEQPETPKPEEPSVSVSTSGPGGPFTSPTSPGPTGEPKDTNGAPSTDDDLKHPPHIHNIDVECGKEMMTINIEFNREFNGIIYSKGFHNNPDCVYVKENSGQTKYSFTVNLNTCGTEFINAFDTEGQSYLENVLVLQNEAGIQEVWDTIRAVRCLWEGNLKDTLSVAFSVGMLTQEIITFSGDTAMAKLDIQMGKGPFAPPANGLVKIGESMTLVVSVTGDPGFDIQVRDCKAKDSTGENSVALTDEDGCVLKPKLFGAFQKTKETGSTGASIIAYAFFNAFKFPDVMDLMIECNIELCKTNCEVCPNPNQPYEPGKKRRRRDVNFNETLGEPVTMGKRLQVILPEDLAEGEAIVNVHQLEGICMSTQSFIFSTALLISLLSTSCLISAYLWIKNQRIQHKY